MMLTSQSHLVVLACILAHGSALTQRLTYKSNENITSFSPEEIQAILHVHNAYRSVIKPTAKYMAEVVWDDDIAAYAQDWANNCTGTHRAIVPFQNYSGMWEAIYTFFGDAYQEVVAVEGFFNESYAYNYETNTCATGKVCGHYYTIIWSQLTRIGCGIKRCLSFTSNPNSTKTYYMVCNYNIMLSKTRPYVSGTPCSGCTSAYPKCRYNLCVTEAMYRQNEGFDGNTTLYGLYRGGATASVLSVATLILSAVIYSLT